MKWVVALVERSTGKQVGEFMRFETGEASQDLSSAITTGSISDAHRFEDLATARKVAAYLPAWEARNEWHAVPEPMDIASFEDGARDFAAKHAYRADLSREQLARGAFFSGASAALALLGATLGTTGKPEGYVGQGPAIKPGKDDAHAG